MQMLDFRGSGISKVIGYPTFNNANNITVLVPLSATLVDLFFFGFLYSTKEIVSRDQYDSDIASTVILGNFDQCTSCSLGTNNCCLLHLK